MTSSGPHSSSEPNSPGGNRDFATTQWHVVRSAGDEDLSVSRSALQELCQQYWYPLYAYVRRQGHDTNVAADITQAFFTDLLEREDIKRVDPELGKFRSFLLASIKHFTINQWKKEKAQKRGGGQTLLSIDFVDAAQRYHHQPADAQSPDVLFERQWAITLLDQVHRRLEKEFELKGKKHVFGTLKIFLAGKSSESTLAQAAAKLDMTEVAAKVAVHRMRTRYGEILRAEILDTLDSTEDVESEVQHLFAVLRS